MERAKLIKIVVAAVIGVVAVVFLAMQFMGGGRPKESKDSLDQPTSEELGGGGRLAPGG